MVSFFTHLNVPHQLHHMYDTWKLLLLLLFESKTPTSDCTCKLHVYNAVVLERYIISVVNGS